MPIGPDRAMAISDAFVGDEGVGNILIDRGLFRRLHGGREMAEEAATMQRIKAELEKWMRMRGLSYIQ